MAGTLHSLHVKKGDKIRRGQEVCIIEAMKMENKCIARKAGIIKEVFCQVGSFVQADAQIYELEPPREDEEEEEKKKKKGEKEKEDELSDDEADDEHDHNWDDVKQTKWTI